MGALWVGRGVGRRGRGALRQPPGAGRGAGIGGSRAALRAKQGQRKWRLHVTERPGVGARRRRRAAAEALSRHLARPLSPGDGCGPTVADQPPPGAGAALRRPHRWGLLALPDGFSGGCCTAQTVVPQALQKASLGLIKGLPGLWWKSDFSGCSALSPSLAPSLPVIHLVKLSVARLLGPSELFPQLTAEQRAVSALETLRNVPLDGHRRAVTAPATWSCLSTIVSYFSPCREVTGSFFSALHSIKEPNLWLWSIFNG